MAAPFFLNGGKMTERANLSDLLKTPNEMASETPEETKERYDIKNEVTETDEKNPRVEWSESDYVAQVPSGTHLHPDIAKDLANRGISAPTTDIGQIRKGDTFVGFDFADAAPVADDTEPGDGDRSDKYNKDGSVRADWTAAQKDHK